MSVTKSTASRRKFVCGGMALGGGLLAIPSLPAAVDTPAGEAGANETLRTIHSLRSIHGDFSAKPVSEADLKTVLEASVRAAMSRQSRNVPLLAK